MTKVKSEKTKSFFLSTLGIVFFIYFFSLFRPWHPFDEKLIYDESLFPIPQRFSEIFEIIQNFVINSHIESLNSTFSNHVAIRSAPVPWSIFVFLFYLFKSNAFFYRLLLVLIHLINTALVWVILKKVSIIFNKFSLLLVSLFTLVWALHSANTEAVLLATNWNGILTFTFCFTFLLYEISRISNKNFKYSPYRLIFISVFFFIQMTFSEHGFSFPLIVLFLYFAFLYRHSNNTLYSFINSIKLTMPYLIGFAIYGVITFVQSDSPIASLFKSQPFYIFSERNLWLTPQIFVHNLKLLFFPKTLSVYQSNHVHLSEQLFDTYSIFCTITYLLFILLPIIVFVFSKRTGIRFICLLFYSFYFSFLPYLHIISPTYCLSADRYCYFPLFMLIFLFFNLVCLVNLKNLKPLIITVSCIVFLLSIRTLIRIQDWNDGFSLYNSALKVDKKPFFRGKKLTVIADLLGSQGNSSKMEEYFEDAQKELIESIKQLKLQKEKNPHEPLTLKLYGLDYETLLVKAAFGIAIIRRDNYQFPAKDVLTFFEPYVNENLGLLACNQLYYYSRLLLDAGQIEKAKKVLEYGYSKFPYYMDLLLLLSDFYLEYEKDEEKALRYLKTSYKYYPNKGINLYKLLHFYEKKGDLQNQAKFAYLLGLRDHNLKSYQKAAQIYLDLNQLPLAKIALKKSVRLNENDPLTLLLMSRYLDLSGKRNKVPEILNTAYVANSSLGDKRDIKVTKGILTSLVNVNLHFRNYSNASKFLTELEQVGNLTLEEKNQIRTLKGRLNQIQTTN